MITGRDPEIEHGTGQQAQRPEGPDPGKHILVVLDRDYGTCAKGATGEEACADDEPGECDDELRIEGDFGEATHGAAKRRDIEADDRRDRIGRATSEKCADQCQAAMTAHPDQADNGDDQPECQAHRPCISMSLRVKKPRAQRAVSARPASIRCVGA